MKAKRNCEKPPSYVIDFHRHIRRMTRSAEWIRRHLLPAPKEARTLIDYFETRLRLEKPRLRYTGKRMDYAWYVKYGSKIYLPLLDYEARQQQYKFLLATLREYKDTICRLPDPARLKTANEKSMARMRLCHAQDALEAAGAWWLDANQREIRRHVGGKERKAFELCAKIHRLSDKALKGFTDSTMRSMKRFTAALKWESDCLARRDA